MGLDIADIRGSLAACDGLEARIDAAFAAMRNLGFDALIYDYTPVPFDLDGAMMIPSLLKLRNVPEDMHDYWCGKGYFRIDPVQRAALSSSAPFFWNYDKDADTKIRRFMGEDTLPVTRFLLDRGLTSGATVPVHMPRGDYATLTGIRLSADRDFQREAESCFADFGLLAQLFHEAAYPLFGEEARRGTRTRLTERERECLRHSAEGLSAKEISRLIDRSVPTVVMHLNAAVRKLGAKNRTQAVVRAAHYRLLDPPGPYNF